PESFGPRPCRRRRADRPSASVPSIAPPGTAGRRPANDHRNLGMEIVSAGARPGPDRTRHYRPDRAPPGPGPGLGLVLPVEDLGDRFVVEDRLERGGDDRRD